MMIHYLAAVPLQVPAPWPWEAIVRLLLAALLGALIGTEREVRGRAAGFRTQLLVALGSCLAMLVSLHFGDVYGHTADMAIRVDPARVAYGVMAGIGFLGAGALIRDRATVRGLTTAASLWCTAAVGLACGFGMYVLATVATIVVLFALRALSRLDRLIPSVRQRKITFLMRAGGKENIQRVTELLRRRGADVSDVEYRFSAADQTETIVADVRISSRAGVSAFTDIPAEAPEVQRLTVE